MKLNLSSNPYRNYDLMISASGEIGYIIVRSKRKGDSHTMSLIPYEKQDSRFAQWVWLAVLKLLVTLHLI